MPTLKIRKSTSLSPQEAFERIKNLLGDDPDLRKLDSSYQCRFNEGTLSGTAEGSKFKAHLQVTTEAQGGCVDLKVDIPLVFTPFKGMVETVLQKKLEKALA